MRKTRLLETILLASCVITCLAAVPYTTSFEDGSRFMLAVQAEMVNGELVVLTDFERSNGLLHEVSADFEMDNQYVLSDSRTDDERASGASGSFYIYVTGWYNQGSDYFNHERHHAAISLTLGHAYSDLEVVCHSEDYDYTKTTLGTWDYYANVDTYASTSMDVDVYFLGIFVGHIYLYAKVYAP